MVDWCAELSRWAVYKIFMHDLMKCSFIFGGVHRFAMQSSLNDPHSFVLPTLYGSDEIDKTT